MKKTIAIGAAVLLLLSATAIVLMQNQGPEGDTVVVKDMLGETVEVKKNPKVVCLSRTSYDPLVAFGLSDYIDGAYKTIFENDWVYEMEPNAKDIGVYDYTESPEIFIEHGVDLVLAPEHHDDVASNLRTHGIVTLVVWPYGNPSFEPYLYYMADLAKQLWPDVEGVAEKADQWKKELSDTIDEIKKTIEDNDLTSGRLYYARGEKSRSMNYTDIGGSFLDYAYKMMGADYISAKYEYNKPSTEQLIADDPEIIILGSYQQHALRDTLDNVAVWSNVSAVKSGRIYSIPIGFSPMEYTSGFTKVFLCDLANKLYPGYFDYDIKSMIRETCSYYYGYQITDEKIQYMIDGLGPDGKVMS